MTKMHITLMKTFGICSLYGLFVLLPLNYSQHKLDKERCLPPPPTSHPTPTPSMSPTSNYTDSTFSDILLVNTSQAPSLAPSAVPTPLPTPLNCVEVSMYTKMTMANLEVRFRSAILVVFHASYNKYHLSNATQSRVQYCCGFTLLEYTFSRSFAFISFGSFGANT